MLKELLSPDVKALIKEGDWRAIKENIGLWRAPDIADFIKALNDKEFFIVFRLLPCGTAAEVFSFLDPKSRLRILDKAGDEAVIDIISSLSPDDRTEFFEEMPGKITQEILSRLPAKVRKESLMLLGYPDGSVGRRMSPDYVSVKPGWTVKRALKHIREKGTRSDTINTVYVTDKDWKLVDDVPLSKLVLAPSSARVESILDGKVVSVSASAREKEAGNLIKKYDVLALPVVDSENILLGVVTVDDMMDVLESAASDDMHKTAAVIPFALQYSSMGYLTLFKKRIMWLMFLGLAGFLSGSVIAVFEATLGAYVALAFFIPTLIGTGGNTAIQASTLIVRAIALNDVTPGAWLNVMKKEILIGVLIGAALSVVLFAGSYVWVRDVKMSAVIGCSVIFIALWANILGSMLPLLLTKMKLDPAVASSPFLTTVLDATGLLIYFFMADFFLSPA